MPIVVDGIAIPDEWIPEEEARLSRDPGLAAVADPIERARLLREAAEYSAENRMLLEQEASRDPRPIPPAVLAEEVKRLRKTAIFGSATDEWLTAFAERSLRVGRLAHEVASRANEPSPETITKFYESNRGNFLSPDRFEASHIVVHVNEARSREQAESAILGALADLDGGMDFATAANKHSDCKGTGGSLGFFLAGTMVAEFESNLRSVAPGQRTGIFTSPFGFHIALLQSLTRGEPVAFEAVQEDIKRVLANVTGHAELLKELGRLRQAAVIERTAVA